MPATLDVERARFNMIEQQIRTWDVLDQDVLDLLMQVRREDFVPPEHRARAFADLELPLVVDGRDTGEHMCAPKIEARILQEIGIRTDDSVLEIGTGSGYMAALLAHRAHHVTTVELLPELVAFARGNLTRAGIANVTVVQGDGARGFATATAPDAIVISGAVPFIPEAFLAQMRVGGRLAAFVGTAPAMSAELVTRTGENDWRTVKLFETVVAPLRNVAEPPKFRF